MNTALAFLSLFFLLDAPRDGCLTAAGPMVLAAELAAAEPAFAKLPPAQEILPAPRPGVQRQVTAAEIRRLASRMGVEAGEARSLCLERAARPLSPGDILPALRQAWIAAGGASDVEISLEKFSQAPVPEGDLEFVPPPRMTVEACRAGLPVIWRGRLRYSRNQSLPVWAEVRIRARREVPVYVRALPAGAVLTAADTAQESLFCGAVALGPFASPREATGRQLRVAVQRGEILSASHFAPEMAIKRGETAAVRIDGLDHIVILAEALSAGRLGERVMLRNPLTGARFQAKATARQEALIVKETAHAPSR